VLALCTGIVFVVELTASSNGSDEVMCSVGAPCVRLLVGCGEAVAPQDAVASFVRGVTRQRWDCRAKSALSSALHALCECLRTAVERPDK